MTRVEKINQAIFVLFTEKEESVRSIQAQLRTYGVELTMVEILTIISSFGLKEVKESHLKPSQIRKAEFRKVIEPVVKLMYEYGVTNNTLFNWMIDLRMPLPNTDTLTKTKVDALILSLEFKFPKPKVRKNWEREKFTKLLLDNLTVEEQKAIESWVK